MDRSEHYHSLLVRFQDHYKIGFLIEKLANGNSVVFFPDAPEPWNGEIIIVGDDQITLIDTASKPSVMCLRRLGAGMAKLLDGKMEGCR